MTPLFALLPEEAYVLIPVGLGLLLILRVLSIGRAMGILGLLLAFALLSPILTGLMNALPLWLLIMLMGIFLYFIVHMLTGAALGKGVRDHFFALILYGIFIQPFRLLGRFVGAIFRTIFRRARA